MAAKKVVDKNATLETAKAAKKATDIGNEELKYLQKKFVSHMSKEKWNKIIPIYYFTSFINALLVLINNYKWL